MSETNYEKFSTSTTRRHQGKLDSTTVLLLIGGMAGAVALLISNCKDPEQAGTISQETAHAFIPDAGVPDAAENEKNPK